jgi:hypothetical protein
MRHLLARSVLVVLGLSPCMRAADAAGPPERCESAKLKATAAYAACLLRAEARARLQGAEAQHAACSERFAKRFGNAEASAGPGTCPSEDDRDAIAAEVAAAVAEVADRLMPPDPACPPGDRDRDPAEVVRDFADAFAARDATALACSYHPDAYMFTDQGVLLGRDEIVAWFLSLWNLFGETTLEIVEDSYYGDHARVLSRLDGGWIVIDDGVDSYEIRGGRIRAQSSHGIIEFTGPPPD